MSEKSGFEELMSQVTAIVTHPVTPWLALGVIALFWILSQVESKIPEDPIERLKRIFGAEKIPHGIALIGVLLWGALILLITFGLITLLYDIVWNTVQPVGREAKADFRFLLTKTAALTAVLGAMIALPFTALRLKLTASQTRHAEDVLFNEKLNDANTDLHARYQTSEKQENGYIDVWKDDIIRRNGAIDRLEALAIERPAMAPRIARMLCVYLREMTRDHPAEKMPEGVEEFEILEWADGLTVQRSDMETAAQVLGRLHELTKVPAQELAIDLTGVNLQAMNLSYGNFKAADFSFADMSGAILQNCNCEQALFTYTKMVGVHALHIKLKHAHIERANMIEASLYGADLSQTSFHTGQIYGVDFSFANFDGTYFLEGSQFSNVELRKSAMKDIDLSEIYVSAEDLEHTFGDASVFLSEDIAPAHWAKVKLDDKEFRAQWLEFETRLPPYD